MIETLRMLTPKDIAEILGVHPKTVHLWLRGGKLKGVKISYRAWRIPQSAFDQFIEQNSNVKPQQGTEEQQNTGPNSGLQSPDATPEPLADNPEESPEN